MLWSTHASRLRALHHLLLAPHDGWLASEFTGLQRATLASYTSAAVLTPPSVQILHLVHVRDSHQRARGRAALPVFDGLPPRCCNVRELALTGYQVQGGLPRRLDVLELHGCSTANLTFAPGTRIRCEQWLCTRIGDMLHRVVRLYHCNKFRQDINVVDWVSRAGVQEMHLVDTSFETSQEVLEAMGGSGLQRLTVACGPHADPTDARKGVAPVLAAMFEHHLDPAFFSVHWRYGGKRYATVYVHRRGVD